MNKNNISEIEKLLRDKNQKTIALVAPSFIVDFDYPSLIWRLRKLGFDKVVELTFGAKMINREYHKILQKNKNKLLIASACPGIVTTIKTKFPKYKNNLIKVDSPMIATAKICKKHFPNHKTVFISPCDFKKIEANQSNFVDYVIDYDQLRTLFKKYKIRNPIFPKLRKSKMLFDKFYNDYTKIYPLSGGLGKSAHINGILNADEIAAIDGVLEIIDFLKKPNPRIRFLDCLYCNGGCIGGPHTNKKLSIRQKHNKVTRYLRRAKKEDIPENRKGLIKMAKGINFTKIY